MIKLYAVILLIFSVLAGPFAVEARAQEQDIVKEPICFRVKNEAPYKVYGSFNTNFYTAPDGKRGFHRANFKLDEAGAKNEEGEAADQSDFCSYGPFFPGRKVEFTLRTLVPIFSCYTKIDQGPIIITGHRKPEGGTVTEAKCFE